MSHPAFTDEDKVFIRAIMTNPAELTAWLVYADWLDEHDDPLRAGYLRLSVQLYASETTQTERASLLRQLKDLRPKLDADWVAVFNRSGIENCDKRFAFQCPKQWEKLKGTDDPTVRFCDACRKKVYYCGTIREAYDHARKGDCVAIDSTVPRQRDDLERDPDKPVIHVALGRLMPPEPKPQSQRPWWKFW